MFGRNRFGQAEFGQASAGSNGIIFDTAATSGYISGQTSFFWEHNTITSNNSLLLVGVSLFNTASVSSITYGNTNSWYNTSWSKRIPLVVQSSQVNANQTNFPVYVNLGNLPASFFATVRSDGGDIRITKADGVTELPREILDINTSSNTGAIYFQADALSASTNTTFFIYYGNATATDYAVSATYGAQHVWDSNYMAVWHLNNNPAGTAPQLIDSTSNANSMTTQGIMTSGELVTGIMDKAIYFNNGANLQFGKLADKGVSDTLRLGGTTAMTIESWINTQNLANGEEFVMSKNLYSSGQGYALSVSTDGAVHFKFNGGTNMTSTAAGVISQNTWNQIIGTFASGTTGSIYKNGALNKTSSWTATSLTASTGDATIAIASDNETTSGYEWVGMLQEIRISNIARSSSYVATSYNNQSSPASFFSIGTVESLTSMQSLTKIRADINGIYRSELWYLVNPATGGNRITVSLSSAIDAVGSSLTYGNVDQIHPIDNQINTTGTGNPASITLMPVSSNTLLIGVLTTPTTSGVTDAAGQTGRENTAGTHGSSVISEKGMISTPASTTLTWNGIGTTDTWVSSAVTIHQYSVVSAIFSGLLALLGVG